jgi:hypothetical protein
VLLLPKTRDGGTDVAVLLNSALRGVIFAVPLGTGTASHGNGSTARLWDALFGATSGAIPGLQATLAVVLVTVSSEEGAVPGLMIRVSLAAFFGVPIGVPG